MLRILPFTTYLTFSTALAHYVLMGTIVGDLLFSLPQRGHGDMTRRHIGVSCRAVPPSIAVGREECTRYETSTRQSPVPPEDFSSSSQRTSSAPTFSLFLQKLRCGYLEYKAVALSSLLLPTSHFFSLQCIHLDLFDPLQTP